MNKKCTCKNCTCKTIDKVSNLFDGIEEKREKKLPAKIIVSGNAGKGESKKDFSEPYNNKMGEPFENSFKFKDLTYNGLNVNKMKFTDIIEEQTRIYFYGADEKNKTGFTFIVLEMSGYYADDENDKVKNAWDKPSTHVEILYQGYAAYDEIRHLYMGHKKNDNVGYLYYPDMQKQILIFEELEKMEAKYTKKNEM